MNKFFRQIWPFILICVLVLLPYNNAWAAGDAVAADITQLQTVISGAPTNGTPYVIEITSDILFEASVIVIPAGANITIRSAQGATYTLTQTAGRHFMVNGTLTLADIILNGGGTGGGVEVAASRTLTLNAGALVTNCYSTGNGGGVNGGLGCTVNIYGGAVDGNTARGYGGGIAVSANSFISMTGGSVSRNTVSTGSATAYGGGIYGAPTLVMTISGGEISYNSLQTTNSISKGGGIYGGRITMTGGKIHHNNAGTVSNAMGGGIYIWRQDSIYMSGGEIYENNATWGGGIMIENFVPYAGNIKNVITGSAYIHGNTATRGGGVAVTQNFLGDPGNEEDYIHHIEISGNAKITGNWAANGGGVFFYVSQNVRGTGSPNAGTLYGGRMLDAVIKDNVEISGNSASSSGGGVYVQNVEQSFTGGTLAYSHVLVTICDTVVIKNNTTEGYGGGLMNTRGDVLITGNAQVTGNTAINHGGGIRHAPSGLYGSSMRLEGNAQITNNTTSGNGGGVCTQGVSEGSVLGPYDTLFCAPTVVFSGNRATAAYADSPQYGHIQSASVSVGGTYVVNNYDILFAGTNRIYYSIRYVANGGTDGDYQGAEFDPGNTDIVLSPEAAGISREEYNFLGWNTKQDGSGTAYAPGDTITLNGSVTLYAQWSGEGPQPTIPPLPFTPPPENGAIVPQTGALEVGVFIGALCLAAGLVLAGVWLGRRGKKAGR